MSDNVESDKQVIKALVFGTPNITEPGDSKSIVQNNGQAKDVFDSVNNDIIKPPYDPATWATLMEKNTRLNRGIRLYANSTVVS